MPVMDKLKAISGSIAIVGVAESDNIGRVPEKGPMELHAEAGRNALADAGIDKSEVDGVFTAGYSTYDIAEYMGITPTSPTRHRSVAPLS